MTSSVHAAVAPPGAAKGLLGAIVLGASSVRRRAGGCVFAVKVSGGRWARRVCEGDLRGLGAARGVLVLVVVAVGALRRLGLGGGGGRGALLVGRRRRGGGGRRRGGRDRCGGLHGVHDGRSVLKGGWGVGRRREGSRDDGVHEDVVLSALDEVVQVLVERRGIVTLEHVVPLLLEPEERGLCALRAVRRPRGQALLRLCATTVRFRGW